MTAKAISFRRGDTISNDGFAGVEGEIVVDLGASKYDNSMATLRIHTGDGTQGGIKLARADCNNVDPEGLTHSLARTSLSNITYDPQNSEGSANVKNVMGGYGLAYRDGTNMKTSALSPDADVVSGGEPSLARRDLSNVPADILKAKVETDNFATTNLDNITNAAIDKIKTDIGLSNYQKIANMETNNVSQDDSKYPSSQAVVDFVSRQMDEAEKIANRKQEITASHSQYPTSLAVINYVSQQIQSGGFANSKLTNIESWSVATLDDKEEAYLYTARVTSSTNGHASGEILRTGMIVNQSTGETMKIIVDEVDANGAVTKISLTPECGTISINQGVAVSGVEVFISSEQAKAGGLAKADLSNIIPVSGTNNAVGQIGYDIDDSENVLGVSQSITTISVTTDENNVEIVTPQVVGMTSTEIEDGAVVSKIGVENAANNIGSGIIIKQDGVYVNVNESTNTNADHKIVLRSELSSHINNKNNPHSVTKAQVGLGNVNNTSDLDKPVSTATQAKLSEANEKINKNAEDIVKQGEKITSLEANKASVDDLTSHTGNKSNPHGVTAAQVGLGNVDNTADLDKEISTKTQAALNLKANASDLTSHAGNKSNPHSVTKAQVGLGNVDNTADSSKPVSALQQAALDLKADKSDTYTKDEVDAKISSVYRFKGTVAAETNLPTSDNTTGDVYNVEATGANYAWDGTAWDKLSETIDLSPYLKASDASNTYLSKSAASTTYATKAELNNKQDQLTAGEGIDITDGVIKNTQTSAEWGKVTGTLSSQADLQGALDAKANDADVVHKTGTETITGKKTFDNIVQTTQRFIINKTWAASELTENTYAPITEVWDRDGVRIAFSEASVLPSNGAFVSTYGASRIVDSNKKNAFIKTSVLPDGTTLVEVTPPADGANNNEVATTKWVNNAIEAALGTVSAELASIIGE